MIGRKEPADDLLPIDRLGEAEEIARAVMLLGRDAGAIISSTPSINGGQYKLWTSTNPIQSQTQLRLPAAP
jgi:hypothetical protein